MTAGAGDSRNSRPPTLLLLLLGSHVASVLAAAASGRGDIFPHRTKQPPASASDPRPHPAASSGATAALGNGLLVVGSDGVE